MSSFNIYKRKDGRFEGRVYVVQEGKRTYRSYYGRDYEEVKNKISFAVPHHIVTEITVREILEYWFKSVVHRVKESTEANYRMKLNKHILPFFANILCSDISDNTIYSFVNMKTKQGLSIRYVSDMVVILKSAFRYSSRTLKIFDPLNGFVLQRPPRSETKILSLEDQKKLTDRFNKATRTDVAIALSLCAGMRIGEVCGLKNEDIDLQNQVIIVNHTVQRIQDNAKKSKTKLIITEPKSAHSKRIIPIPDGIVPLLVQFRGSPNEFILSGADKPVEPRTMQNRFAAILKSENLPRVRYHSLRHAFATRAVEVGFDIKTLSEILGHSSVELTLNLYVHSSLERKRACMSLMTV